jgi:hypothetical protein
MYWKKEIKLYSDKIRNKTFFALDFFQTGNWSVSQLGHIKHRQSFPFKLQMDWTKWKCLTSRGTNNFFIYKFYSVLFSCSKDTANFFVVLIETLVYCNDTVVPHVCQTCSWWRWRWYKLNTGSLCVETYWLTLHSIVIYNLTYVAFQAFY